MMINKTKRAILGTLLFVLILLIYYYIHSQYMRVDVVFYSAIKDGLLAVVTSLLLFYLPYFNIFNIFEKIQMVTIWLLLSYIFAISVPTVLDRSLSFYILEKIAQRGGGIKESGFQEVFTDEYVKEHRLIDVRLTEQERSGTISIQNGCVKLTEKGKKIAKYSRFFRKHFLPKHRLLMGKYTDDLTDPFGHGAIDKNRTFDYICN